MLHELLVLEICQQHVVLYGVMSGFAVSYATHEGSSPPEWTSSDAHTGMGSTQSHYTSHLLHRFWTLYSPSEI